jgi:mono/diheme cytochrome c family protein
MVGARLKTVRYESHAVGATHRCGAVRVMSRKKKTALTAFVFLVLLGAIGVAKIRAGFSARDEPWRIEAFFARHVRILAIPASARELRNPVPSSIPGLQQGMAHFADHCAICHANDGSGRTTIGMNTYPKSPDMREQNTQSLTDGELYYVIRNGIRFTAMPGWGEGETVDDEETWNLVHFIRHLPAIRPDELEQMQDLNPKTSSELQEEERIRRFLAGDDGAAATPQAH